jgi:two-component system, NtrC family, sensor histidine kinase KinB
MTVRARLLLSVAPLAAALVLLGLFAVRSVSYLGETSETILAENYRSVLAAQRMKEALERIDSELQLVATGRRDSRRSLPAEPLSVFESELQVEEGNITEPGEQELAAALRRGFEEYRLLLDKCLAEPRTAAIESCYFAELEPRFRALKDDADRVLALNQDAMVAKSDRVHGESERLGSWMLAAALTALAIGLATSWRLATRELRPLETLGRAVEQFGRGDFAVRASARGGAEIAGLAATFNAMADRIEEYRRSSLGEMMQAQLAAQATLDSFPDPVLVLAVDQSVVSLNPAAAALLAEGGEQRPRLALLPPALRDAVLAVHSHVLRGKGAFAPRGFDEACSVQTPQGERVFLPRAAPVYEEGGGVVAVTVVLQDVTRLRRFEELHDDLVSTVAHQFRTPLTSVRMALHLCLEGAAGPLAAKQQDLLYAAREECERLHQIVDELLDLARLQSGRVELELAPAGAEELLARAERTYRAAAAAKGVSLGSEPVLRDLVVRADAQRVSLVFANLLENALRYTPEGGRILLRAADSGGWVRFEVADTGTGVPEDQRARIFEKFQRGPEGGSGGVGLGLAIARDVVRAHGGEIGVEGTPGGGASFWFTLPAAEPAPPAPQSP